MKNIDWFRYALLFTMAAIILALILRYDAFRTQLSNQAYEDKQRLTQEAISSANNSNDSVFESQSIEQQIPKTTTTEFDVDALPAVDNNAATNLDQLSQNANQIITVQTDLINAQIDLLGGDIVMLQLRKHNERQNFESPVQLLQNIDDYQFLAQSGIIEIEKNQRPLYTADRQQYTMENGVLQVKLSATIDNIIVTKTYEFKPNNYAILVQFTVENQSDSNFPANMSVQFSRNDYKPNLGGDGMGMAPFVGPAITTNDERYKRFDFEDLNKRPYKEEIAKGWVAMVQRYFTTAWVSQGDNPIYYSLRQSKNNNNLYLFGYQQRGALLKPSEIVTIESLLYAGPKDQYQLATLSPNLDLTVDYSWLWWAAQPLFYLLNFFYSGTFHFFGSSWDIWSGSHNWGVSIILLTFLVKLVFFRLSATSYKSMARMRKLQPKMMRLKEMYGSDRQKMSQETMKLYKKEKVNPLGGCLPMLIQMPIFLALYWVLLESVELRHAPFVGWIIDLSARDPWFVLPILMGISMYVQFQLNPTPPDPMQAKVMQFMPLFLTLIFLFMPAGLVLYWTVNNILSIAQQWYITNKIVT